MKRSRRNFLKDIGLAGIGISFTGALGACSHRGGRTLNLYTWDTYIGKHTLPDFEKAAGAHVNISLFANNDELFAKLRDGNPGYDVIVPSNDFVERLHQIGALADIDHAKVPNLANIDPRFLNPPFDPGRKVSVPYTWIVTGIGYRKSKVDGVPDSWKWVLDSDRYKGRIGLLAEASELFEIGTKYLGLPANTADPATIARVQAMLLKQKPNIATFHDDNGQDLLLGGDIDLVIEYNGDIAQVMREDKDLAFVVPKEGGILASDGLCIPKGAPNPDLAHAFINFVLDAHNGAHIAETIRYPTPNKAALALMPPDYRDSPVIFPPADALAKCEYSRYKGLQVQAAYEDAMTRVRAG
ncbi:spermidine/putrescine ABC transporter periplasmic spermidine/putrescine-binding protein [Novosphingobium nitrogenifigens DSM 19370]|uniref:Putrescine-binding periplasmic protein n=1 Tax=Novosphingobium nitrogenifigens DSM 19370 TaxID=983920 RepID=F1Z7T6_9SPHN|nr:spermidine/putrescine ABC transporter substrate-binding protein [Novosphingobium nitrogenifigens]EGD59289.1 spermidine/putrescine ABC transporter periplasmic spermidine/putrescine-binding protein [Novosphingobium nitrogenifigens DSM 19370]